MNALKEEELKLFVDSVRHYFRTTTQEEPRITSAYLDTGDLQGHEFNGVVGFAGEFNGHVLVSMPGQLLRELLMLQRETDLSEGNLLDAVGEIANTLAGNARRYIGSGLDITVPMRVRGPAGISTRVRERPYVITLRWCHLPALVCVDLARR